MNLGHKKNPNAGHNMAYAKLHTSRTGILLLRKAAIFSRILKLIQSQSLSALLQDMTKSLNLRTMPRIQKPDFSSIYRNSQPEPSTTDQILSTANKSQGTDRHE
jgi:hypothetical protein